MEIVQAVERRQPAEIHFIKCLRAFELKIATIATKGAQKRLAFA